MKKDETEIKENVLNVFIENKKIFFIIVGIWSVFTIIVITLGKVPYVKLGNMGVFGDSFNVLTSLFTGLAFAGVIVSVILQTTELKDARVEFRRQAKALEMQQLDNKFFQMLNELNNLIGRLKDESGNGITGHAVFEKLFNSLSVEFVENGKEEFQKKFEYFNNYNDKTFKYYFINLYQIINYIDKNVQTRPNVTLEEEEDAKKLAKEYINIIRAQQTKIQLKLLFLNGIGVIEFCGDNGDRYKKLIEKYALFEHIRYQDLLSGKTVYKSNGRVTNPETELKNELHKKVIDALLIQYEKEAFGNNSNLIAAWENRKSLLLENSEGEQVT